MMISTATWSRLPMVCAAAVLTAGCFAAAAHADPITLAPADAAGCGAFSVIDHLVRESLTPDPGPGGAPSRTYDLVGLANALNNVDKRGISSDLDDDITAYVYALTNVGAAINRREPTDLDVVSGTRDKVATRCAAGPGQNRAPELPTTSPDESDTRVGVR